MTVQLAVKANSKQAGTHGEPAWEGPAGNVLVGKDILELLSSSMYVDPMTVYREYVQNAADALDDVRSGNGTVPDAAKSKLPSIPKRELFV